jgi:protoporphyrinogen IX oxidase
MTQMYEWVKVIHLFADFAWMAGLFYLPRLFVYHADEVAGSVTSETFKVMERRLLKAIMRPAALVAVISGLALMHLTGVTEGWIWVKLLAVLGLVMVHGMLEKYVRLFAGDARPKHSRYFRILNEVPTVLLLVIIIMVVVRPF